MDASGAIKNVGELWDHTGAVGIGFLLVGLAFVVFSIVMWFSWRVSWRILEKQSTVDAALAATQQQLVTYVTSDHKDLQKVISTNSVVTGDVSNRMGLLTVSNDRLSGAMEVLANKMGSDPGCKIKDVAAIQCKAAELGVTPESFKETLSYVKAMAEHLAAIKEKQDIAKKLDEAIAAEKRHADDAKLQAAATYAKVEEMRKSGVPMPVEVVNAEPIKVHESRPERS